ncbi:choice-of-anchor Q domain-containing protein [Salinimicrobium catena]|uniref:choice-of-anchor Q domain-containing protein n=1 Tax=Salinimicrobium catena TaxID=390640 RepID=UPI002FE4C6A3
MGNLEFSRDTVYLDTVFTGLSSSTHTLKVYNRSNEDIHIPQIALGRGESSAYRLNVDGLPGKSFSNVEIMAKDSIYIFIETTVDLQETDQKEFLYNDAIEFISSGHRQEVPLVTLVKDAIFLYPDKDEEGGIETIPLGVDEQGEEIRAKGFLLEEQHLNFTNEKAYVIYGYAVVPSGKTLTINAGARIYFHENSGIIVSDAATLNVKGSLSENRENPINEVIFQGDRLSEEFENIPGQWGTIWFKKGSFNNSFQHATIRNATVGILAEGNQQNTAPLLQLKNTQIYNSAVNGLRGVGARITAENLVINSSGQSSVHLTGGAYDFKHSTLLNYWNEGFRLFPAVLLENEITTATNVQTIPLEKALFSNCIIYGNERQELLFNRNESAVFNFEFRNCLIRFEDPSAEFASDLLYDFTDDSNYSGIILNENPFFWNVDNNDFSLQEGSPAIDTGNVSTANEVPFDILNVSRLPEPDLGAYEWVKK